MKLFGKPEGGDKARKPGAGRIWLSQRSRVVRDMSAGWTKAVGAPGGQSVRNESGRGFEERRGSPAVFQCKERLVEDEDAEVQEGRRDGGSYDGARRMRDLLNAASYIPARGPSSGRALTLS